MKDADREIVHGIRSGDRRKFGLLVDRHKDRAMTLAVRLVGDRSAAEELVQDAFLRAYRALDGFRGDAKFSTWFYRILYNVCMTHLRRAPAPHEELPDDLPADADEWSGEPSGILERIEKDEISGILLDEMSRLPASYRGALTLFYVQDLKYEEIAQVLDIPLGTVKTCLSRGRALLRMRVSEKLKHEGHAA